MLIRILISAIYIAVVTVCEYSFDFLRVGRQNIPATVFTLFITFQLFNAFNARQTNSQSILKNFAKNKIMPITFLLAFVLQYLIVTFFYEVFGVSPMSFYSWLKVSTVAFSVVVVSEMYKMTYRLIRDRIKQGLIIKNTNYINKNSLGA
jgi:Ca2+-transporting ATPase